MTINMKQAPLFKSIEQIEEFLKVNKASSFDIEIISKKNKYKFINDTLWRIKYRSLSKGEKHVVLKFLKFFTKYSKGHLKKMAQKWIVGILVYNPSRKRYKFAKKFYPQDIALLIKTDLAHSCLSAQATCEILRREYEIFKNADYGKISQISKSHIYNLRSTNNQYISSPAMKLKRTNAVQNNIGKRRKPEPNGRPGCLRIDTVHQGDFLGNKGVYHINIVDEVTQYEMIATVELISERYLKPVIEELLKLFPFRIFEFHADNGSEYINHYTVKLLNKLHIELTKSRSRHSNDNALVESKNGSIIRKEYGRNFIAKKWAKKINEFNKNYFNIYLNFHRPCAFAIDEVDKKGKIKKKYTHWMTPYEKFKLLPNAEKYLKPDFDFKDLNKIAYEKSDNEFAEEMKKAKSKLFRLINKDDTIQKIREKELKKQKLNQK